MTEPRRPIRAEGPYRATFHRATRIVRDGLSAQDLLVLAALALCIASVGYWHQAVEAFSTRVLGFPSLR